MTYVTGVLASLIAAIYIVHHLRFRKPLTRLDLGTIPARPPAISVLVPARNEAATIRRCIDSLLAQEYQGLEIIVVDDGSNDETPRIVEEMRNTNIGLRLIRTESPPAGWFGKAHALQLGLEAATGSIIICTDADARFSPQAVAGIASILESRPLDAVSVLPELENRSIVSRIVHPVMLESWFTYLPIRAVEAGSSRTTLASGACFAVHREALDAVGGFAPVRASLAEDVELACELKRQGYRVGCRWGRASVSVETYRNARELFAGWGKNLYPIFRCNFPATVYPAAMLSAGVLYPLSPILALVALATGSPAAALLLLLPGIIQGALMTVRRVRYGLDILTVPLYPLGGLIFIGLMVYSYLVSRGIGRIRWKGRTLGRDPSCGPVSPR